MNLATIKVWLTFFASLLNGFNFNRVQMTSRNYWRTNNKTNVRFESSESWKNALQKVNSNKSRRRTCDEKVPSVGAFKVKTKDVAVRKYWTNNLCFFLFRAETLFFSVLLFLPFSLSFDIFFLFFTIHTHTERVQRYEIFFETNENRKKRKRIITQTESGMKVKNWDNTNSIAMAR